jgi:hypothetical protein
MLILAAITLTALAFSRKVGSRTTSRQAEPVKERA